MSGGQASDMLDVLRRLEFLEQERAVLHTLYSYCFYLDHGRQSEFVDLFTADAVLEVRSPVRAHCRRHVGRDALARFIASYATTSPKRQKHLLAESRITINGDEAEAHSYWASLYERDGEPYVNAFGRYQDRLVKQDNVWRLREKVVEMEARKSS